MPPILLVLSAAVALQAPAGGSFLSKVGGFRVDFPGKPTDRPVRQETPFGPIEGRSYGATRGKLAFFVSYSDYPADAPRFEVDEVLERSVNSALGGVMGVTLVSKEDIRLGDVPGKEFAFTYPDGDDEPRLCRARYYLSGHRFYTLMARGPQADVARVATPFFRSFLLFPPEKAPEKPAKPANPGPQPTSLTTKPGATARAAPTKPFISPEGRFRVSLPGKPRQQTLVQHLPGGGTVQAHLVVALEDDVRRLVSFIDRPKALEPHEVESGLEELVKGSIVSGQGTLVSQRPIRLGEAPGREFEFDSVGPDGRPRYVRARAYLVGPRIYQVLIGGPRAKVAGPAGDAFLNSFSLVGPTSP